MVSISEERFRLSIVLNNAWFLLDFLAEPNSMFLGDYFLTYSIFLRMIYLFLGIVDIWVLF